MAGYPILGSSQSFSSAPLTTKDYQSNKIRTVKIGNLSPGASAREIREFFKSSGEIEYIELHSYFEQSQIAYVTFKDSKGADNAARHSGNSILGSAVVITLASDHHLPHAASSSPLASRNDSFRKAEDAFSSILAKGYELSKGALDKAKSFDERHRLTRSTSEKIASINKRIGLSEKVIFGASVVNGKVQEVDQKLQVSEKVKSAYATAGQTVTSARSAVMNNEYVNSGTSMVTGAFDKVASAAEEVGRNTKAKLGMAEKEASSNISEAPKPSEGKEQNASVPLWNKV
ncbi:Binding partner of ACD [Heracleum sosnowskyi]|uniref:Binding partner of ACD n=1 Tax=Heracleum sosnowskyi TaxID=360622 RepID=A0AAD8HBS8_9APIA|nr:Binding partner of ACD [Heracleum sosnowskyi]